jgi:hypothetical protein
MWPFPIYGQYDASKSHENVEESLAGQHDTPACAGASCVPGGVH